MKQILIFLTTGLFCLLLLGCGGEVTAVSTPTPLAQLPIEAATPSPSPTDIATPVPTATQTKQIIPTTTPTQTPKPTNTATATASSKAVNSELLARLVTAREQGFSLSSIQLELEAEGWMPQSDDEIISQLWTENSLSWLATDIDGDGSDEWFISILTSEKFDSCGYNYIGELWIINDGGLVIRINSQSDFPFWNVPLIIGQFDVTGDEIADVITQSIGCSAHTNFAMYNVISGHRGQIANIISVNNDLENLARPLRSLGEFDPNEEWSTPGISISNDSHDFYDETGDGIIDLVLVGGTFNSAGAGYHRSRTEIWTWDGTTLTLSDIDYYQTGARIHVLFDANLSFLRGDLESAKNLYIEVIENDSLDDSVAFFAEDGGYSDARQFAAFRLALLFLVENDLNNAQEWQNWLKTEYVSSPLTEAVNILLESWQQSISLSQACTAITNFLKSYENPTGSLSDTGYGNPGLFAEDVCSIGNENE